MNFDKHSFCPEVWSQIEIDAQGDYKLCCLSNLGPEFGMALDDNDQIMNVMTHSIQEAINSKTHRLHRLQLSQNIRPARCRNCYESELGTKTENSEGQSKRQRVIHITSKSIKEYVTLDSVNRYTDKNGISSAPIVNLDIRFGNICNQKCLMCSPQHSSLWYEDWLKLAEGGNDQFNRSTIGYKKGKYKDYPLIRNEYGKIKMQGLEPWWETDIWWNRFDEISPNLRYIYFTGGEPLIVPAMEECLDRLIKNGYASNIELRYDTNLSVINKKIIDKWKYFKKLYLAVSLDDVDDRYELIRFPGNFEKFKSNLDFLKKNQIPINYLSSCIGIATVYAMERVIKFCKENNVKYFFRFLEYGFLDLRFLPRTAKEEIINVLKTKFITSNNEIWYGAQIKLLEKYLDQENLIQIAEFVRVMNILDKQRSTNWKKTLPDVVNLLETHCSDIDLNQI